jgi:predicted Zn-dependent protease
MPRKPALRLEYLESRTVPALFGTPWADPQHLTLSFVPDGTNVDGAGSSLAATLGGDTGAWQAEILRAVQTWTAYANINVTVVADSGAALGTPGALQGDARFGDIRIAARPLSDNELAITDPSGFVGGTRTGDIVLNSQQPINIGGTDNHYDLYTVLLQEVGHALGVSNSADPMSVMYEAYGGARSGLSGSDIASIQALYGARTISGSSSAPSAGPILDDAHTNDFIFLSTLLSTSAGFASHTRYSTLATLRDASDVDFYRVRVPSSGDALTVNVRALNPAALAPVVQLYDEDRHAVAATVLANGNGTYTVQLPNAVAGQDCYYVRVAAGNANGTGDYQLDVDFRLKAVSLDAIADGTLTSAAATDFRTLTANRSQVMHFALSAASDATAAQAGVRMAVFDSQGHVKATLFAKAGQTVSLDLFLDQGDYTVRFEGLTAAGSLPSLSYALRGITLTDPIGPTGSDPTLGDGGTITNDTDWVQGLLDYYDSLVLDPAGTVVW